MRKLDPRQLKVGDLIFQALFPKTGGETGGGYYNHRLVLSVEHNTFRGVADEKTVTIVVWDLGSEEKFDFVFGYDEHDTWLVADEDDGQ